MLPSFFNIGERSERLVYFTVVGMGPDYAVMVYYERVEMSVDRGDIVNQGVEGKGIPG